MPNLENAVAKAVVSIVFSRKGIGVCVRVLRHEVASRAVFICANDLATTP